jgi:hypothetical protein
MRAKLIGLATAAVLIATAPFATAAWRGDSKHATDLIANAYSKKGMSARVIDTGKTFDAGGVSWRVYEVSWDKGGFRHVAVHRQRNGEYVAIEGIERDKKWSQAVSLGR